MLFTFFAIVLGTFASEDLTCIATGVLIQRGEIGLTTGIGGCVAGIFLGDVGLWAIGRLFGRAALAWPWVARHVDDDGTREFAGWLERHAAGMIVGSRFLPGTRLPLYVVAGVLRMPPAVFAWWALVGAVLWSPTIVLLTATLGEAFTAPLASMLGSGWPVRIGAATLALAVLRSVRGVATPAFRRRAAARMARWVRWEFWPMWLFYAPVAAWVAALAIRYRGLSALTAANPGIPDGGTVGESKFAILAKLPADCTIPAILIPAAAVATAGSWFAEAKAQVEAAGWTLPLILKPDVGQRGVGVKLARRWDDVDAYLARVSGAVVVQPYHPGPFEAGVFYYRMPGARFGRILSITDKQFPVIIGDGRHTIEDLIWSHPRYRLQAGTFLTRHHDVRARVLDAGERFQLAIAGNHAQGTLFRDGAHLITPALERRIDEIARTFPGFYIGRFDIRYADADLFKAGRDVAIVELNGATSESTSIYDPATSIVSAYRQLFQQWALVFKIGAANRAAGAPVSSMRRLVALVREHLRSTPPFPISD